MNEVKNDVIIKKPTPAPQPIQPSKPKDGILPKSPDRTIQPKKD